MPASVLDRAQAWPDGVRGAHLRCTPRITTSAWGVLTARSLASPVVPCRRLRRCSSLDSRSHIKHFSLAMPPPVFCLVLGPPLAVPRAYLSRWPVFSGSRLVTLVPTSFFLFWSSPLIGSFYLYTHVLCDTSCMCAHADRVRRRIQVCR